jgi:hypothetical protein
MYNVKEIPIELENNNKNKDIDLSGICVRSPNFENYLYIKDNTIGVLKFNDSKNLADISVDFNHKMINDSDKFVFVDGSINAYNDKNTIIWSTNTNKNFDRLSLNNEGNIIFSDITKTLSMQLIYNFSEITTKIPFTPLKNNVLLNNFETIKNNVIDYNNILMEQIKKEYPDYKYYADIRSYPNDINLNNIVLYSPNKQHYLVCVNNNITVLNLSVDGDVTTFQGKSLGIKNTSNIYFTTDGNITFKNNQDKILFSSNIDNKVGLYSLSLNNSGQLVFTNINQRNSKEYYLYELSDIIPKNINITNDIIIKNFKNIIDKLNDTIFGISDNIADKNTLNVKKDLQNKINNIDSKQKDIDNALQNKNLSEKDKDNLMKHKKLLDDEKTMTQIKHDEINKNEEKDKSINCDKCVNNNDKIKSEQNLQDMREYELKRKEEREDILKKRANTIKMESENIKYNSFGTSAEIKARNECRLREKEEKREKRRDEELSRKEDELYNLKQSCYRKIRDKRDELKYSCERKTKHLSCIETDDDDDYY